MAKVRTNVIVQGVSGAIGRLIFRLMPNGETYVSSAPDFSKRKFSKGQKEHQSRFQQASLYARDAAKRHPIYAAMAKGTVKSPYNIALADWWHAPVIHFVERKNESILVQASDDVMVVRVEVAIMAEDGKTLMKGDATPSGKDLWRFVSDVEGKVVAKVWDLAGNVVSREF